MAVLAIESVEMALGRVRSGGGILWALSLRESSVDCSESEISASRYPSAGSLSCSMALVTSGIVDIDCASMSVGAAGSGLMPKFSSVAT